MSAQLYVRRYASERARVNHVVPIRHHLEVNVPNTARAICGATADGRYELWYGMSSNLELEKRDSLPLCPRCREMLERSQTNITNILQKQV